MSKSVESSNPRVESPNVFLNAPKNSKPNSHVGNANDPKTVMTQQLLTLGTVRSPGTKSSTVQEQSASSEPDPEPR